MAKIRKENLLAYFERMLTERWAYEWGAAREGCVDCSGAFVFAYKRLGGLTIAHGSNSIFRQSIGKVGKEPKPGYAAFKCKPWTDEDASNSWYGTAPGNISHIGLVDESGKGVLNAKGTAYGFCRDKASGYQYFAPLTAVDYTQTEEKQMDMCYDAVCTGEKVRVRESPNGKIIGHLQRGEAVLVTDGSNGEWLRVQWKGDEGFVAGQYLQGKRKEENTEDEDKKDNEEKTNARTTLWDEEGNEVTLLGRWRIAQD